MEKDQAKIHIGFVTYGKSTLKYLPYFLPSLKSLDYGNLKISAVDNSEPDDRANANYIKDNFPEIALTRAGKNLGFAKAFNIMIRQAAVQGVDYFLALNPDMVLKPESLTEAVKAAAGDERCGAVAWKILKWDFAANKLTDKIDSLGLKITPDHRFFDSGQGEPDKGDEKIREVFGFTGAAVLLNLKALDDASYDRGGEREYFDELMFMYKEDCDLSYRLRLAGWKIILAPKAVAYHDRSAAQIGESNLKIALNRASKSKLVKKWSYLNQLILLSKIKNLPFSGRVKLSTAWYQFKCLVFAAIFEPYLIKELFKLSKLKNEIKARRDQLKTRVDIKEIEKFMYEN